MYSTTQMMASKPPKLFYLFRRAFGFSCLLVSLFCSSQMTLIDAVIIDTEKENSYLSVTAETYLHHPEKTTNTKILKEKKVAERKVTKRKNAIAKITTTSKNQKINAKSYYSFNTDKHSQRLKSTVLKNIVISGSVRDYRSSDLQCTVKLILYSDYRRSSSKILSTKSREDSILSTGKIKGRGPPSFVAI